MITMPDNLTTTVLDTDIEGAAAAPLGALPPDHWFSWEFTASSGGPVQTFEFPSPLSELDASNRIAKYLGIDTLPVDSTVIHPEPVIEEADAKDGKPTPKPPPPPEPEPEPEPTPDPEPEPEPPAP